MPGSSNEISSWNQNPGRMLEWIRESFQPGNVPGDAYSFIENCLAFIPFDRTQLRKEILTEEDSFRVNMFYGHICPHPVCQNNYLLRGTSGMMTAPFLHQFVAVAHAFAGTIPEQAK
jgi:hypothetical protein